MTFSPHLNYFKTIDNKSISIILLNVNEKMPQAMQRDFRLRLDLNKRPFYSMQTFCNFAIWKRVSSVMSGVKNKIQPVCCV